jgi:quercetin dioxygenase-like cupin family protein
MRVRPSAIAPLALAVLVLGGVAGAAAYAALVAEPAAPVPVVRTALAEAPDPSGAKDRTLGLSRVTVAPGAVLALHRHPGTQAAYVARGTLTYSVVRGAVRVRQGAPGSGQVDLVRRIGAGQTGRIRAGEWIVERPGTIHHAANRGSRRIVIYLATLFRSGRPPAIPVAVTEDDD